jgi:hypothetical protein
MPSDSLDERCLFFLIKGTSKSTSAPARITFDQGKNRTRDDIKLNPEDSCLEERVDTADRPVWGSLG